jgi:ubiquinone/menaquinone biosynthesis C-methylase UbiE
VDVAVPGEPNAPGKRGAQREGVEEAWLDPEPFDWAGANLPDGWPDRLRLRDPVDLVAFLRRLLGRRRRVEVPDSLPGADTLPEYLRQEFHHLPNGNYSKRIVAGYARSFDLLMLGRARRARRAIARRLAACRRVLDVGCGAGGLAGALLAAGVPEVWGLDASPYLLREAARKHPRVRLVQGLAERSRFADGRFDGAGACFLFHELPPAVADRALAELHRILAPGATLVIVEPSPLQFRPRELARFVRSNGLAGVYFWLLARSVHEPFAAAWHRRDVLAWMTSHGFALREDVNGMPLRLMSAVRT